MCCLFGSNFAVSTLVFLRQKCCCVACRCQIKWLLKKHCVYLIFLSVSYVEWRGGGAKKKQQRKWCTMNPSRPAVWSTGKIRVLHVVPGERKQLKPEAFFLRGIQMWVVFKDEDCWKTRGWFDGWSASSDRVKVHPDNMVIEGTLAHSTIKKFMKISLPLLYFQSFLANLLTSFVWAHIHYPI